MRAHTCTRDQAIPSHSKENVWKSVRLHVRDRGNEQDPYQNRIGVTHEEKCLWLGGRIKETE